MILVVDTNILVSFFRQNPVNEIICKSKSFNLHIFSPEFALDELQRHMQDVLAYAKLTPAQFREQLSKLSSFITIVPNKEFKQFESEAQQLSPHDKDISLFALALKLKCPIWSNEPAFKQQSTVDVLSNRDMIELFDSFLA